MGIAHELVRRILGALRPRGAGTRRLAANTVGTSASAVLRVTSSAFRVGEALPRSATVEGEGRPPPIAWEGVPERARSMVIVCEDPDAPLGRPFVHWLVYGIAPRDGRFDPSRAAAREGINSKGRTGFAAAAPPPGHSAHHYHFQVFALDAELALDEGLGRSTVIDAMRGHVLAWGDLVGIYGRRA